MPLDVIGQQASQNSSGQPLSDRYEITSAFLVNFVTDAYAVLAIGEKGLFSDNGLRRQSSSDSGTAATGEAAQSNDAKQIEAHTAHSAGLEPLWLRCVVYSTCMKCHETIPSFEFPILKPGNFGRQAKAPVSQGLRLWK